MYLPDELLNIIFSFREINPTAKLIRQCINYYNNTTSKSLAFNFYTLNEYKIYKEICEKIKKNELSNNIIRKVRYFKFLTEELNQLKDEVIKYKITHKTTLIKDKELLHRIQDNFLKRECLKPYDDKMLFLSECLSG